jgi:hypothetical protein
LNFGDGKPSGSGQGANDGPIEIRKSSNKGITKTSFAKALVEITVVGPEDIK